MASATLAPETLSTTGWQPSDRVLLRHISWELYETLRAEESNWHVRMSYCDGDLELMSPAYDHEEFAFWLSLFVTSLARVLRFKLKGLAHTTWKRKGLARGKEADACFYIASFARIRKKKIDLEVDPPPDLAIEVEMSRSAINALSIYAALGVPEVWRFDGETLIIEVRQDSGGYVQSQQSLALPYLKAVEIQDWIKKAAELDDDMEWVDQLEAWIREVLVPRRDLP